MKHPRHLQILSTFGVFALTFFVSCSLMFYSCKKNNPVAPGPQPPDTTSHDFVWEQIKIGDDHSYLNDIYALNDTDVWAVGLFTTRKPNGDLLNHNALHWDGKTWTIIDVPISLPGTGLHTTGALLSVIVFDHTDVWLAIGDVIFWDGRKYIEDPQIHDWFPKGVYKMWGKNRNDVYLVGGLGGLAHYDGHGFHKMIPNTNSDINDVWGVGDTALCIASNWFGNQGDSPDSYIYRLVNGKAEIAYQQGLDQGLKSIWFCQGMRNLTAVGSWHEEWDGIEWKRMINPSHWFRMGIRGNSPNDYFVVDQRSGIEHFNGKTWKQYTEGVDTDLYFHAVTCTPRNVWAVADNDMGRLVIVHGTRK